MRSSSPLPFLTPATQARLATVNEGKSADKHVDAIARERLYVGGGGGVGIPYIRCIWPQSHQCVHDRLVVFTFGRPLGLVASVLCSKNVNLEVAVNRH